MRPDICTCHLHGIHPSVVMSLRCHMHHMHAPTLRSCIIILLYYCMYAYYPQYNALYRANGGGSTQYIDWGGVVNANTVALGSERELWCIKLSKRPIHATCV